MNISVVAPSTPTTRMGTPLTTSISLTLSQSSDDIVDSYTISYTGMTGCASGPSDSKTLTGSTTSHLLSSLEEAIE